MEGYELAGWLRRAVAATIDFLIVTCVFMPTMLVAIALFHHDTGALVAASWVVLLGSIILYPPLVMCRAGKHNGQTWGKQLCGIRVVRDDEQPVDFGYGLVRDGLVKGLGFNWIGAAVFAIPCLINYLWPLGDSQNRALHDKIVKSHVVRA